MELWNHYQIPANENSGLAEHILTMPEVHVVGGFKGGLRGKGLLTKPNGKQADESLFTIAVWTKIRSRSCYFATIFLNIKDKI